MIFDWTDILMAAIRTLPELHRDIVVRTMALPGKRKRLFYSDAKNIWNLDRPEFDRQRQAAFESVRRYLVGHGLRRPGDLVFVMRWHRTEPQSRSGRFILNHGHVVFG